MKLKLSQACMLVCQQRPEGCLYNTNQLLWLEQRQYYWIFFLNYFTYIYMRFQFATVKSSFSVVSRRLLHCKWYESSRIFRGNIHFILYNSKKTTNFKKIRGNFNWFLCLNILKSTNASSSHSLHSISEFITDDNTNERTIFWS